MNKPIVGATVGTPIKPDKFAGKSAYDIAKKYGFKGTEKQWLDSLRGKSAYDYAVELGFNGTEEEYRAICEAQAILSIVQTVVSTESGGENVWTATFGSGNQVHLKVRNGKDGIAGNHNFSAEVVDGVLVIRDAGSDGADYVLLKDNGTGKSHKLRVENGELRLAESEG